MVRRSLSVALLLTIACGSDTGPDTEPGPTSEVRLLHGATDAAMLDLLVGNQVVLNGVEFRHTSAFVEVPAGARMLAVRKSGNSALLRSLEATLTPGLRYSVMAGGAVMSVAPVSASLDTGAVKPDRANLRIINVATAPDSGHAGAAVIFDVHITAPGAALAGHAAQFSLDVRYPSYSTFLYFDPGTWVVRFTRADGSIAATSEATEVASGQARAFLLEKGGDGVYLLTVLVE